VLSIWLMLVILTTQEVETRRVTVRRPAQAKSSENPF
jgi:hypothetical protein